jgi:hypothetical protein
LNDCEIIKKYEVWKYCPARWIRFKLGSFDRSSLKEVSRRLFRKICPAPYWVRAL